MLKGSKPPLPAPRQRALGEHPPPLPVRQRKDRTPTERILHHRDEVPTTTADQMKALKDFAIRKNFTDVEFQKALSRTVSLDDTNAFLAQLITVRGEPGTTDQNKLKNHDLNWYNRPMESDRLRGIVIDGSNVAMNHGNGQVFSSRGIQIAVEWFQDRGHKAVTVFVPSHRKDVNKGNRDVDILHSLEAEGNLKFTPSREGPNGSRVTCYDDRFILRYASEEKAIVVSNDHFKDLASEDSGYRETIDQRLLGYIFVNDRFMPAEDPMGRKGLTLDQFLRMNAVETGSGQCPYGRKCTYGNKCKYDHPERTNSAIIGDLQPRKIQQRERDLERLIHATQTALQASPKHQPTPLELHQVTLTSFPDLSTSLSSLASSASITSMPSLASSPSDTSLPSLVSRCVGDVPEPPIRMEGLQHIVPKTLKSGNPSVVRTSTHTGHAQHTQQCVHVYPEVQRRTVQQNRVRSTTVHTMPVNVTKPTANRDQLLHQKDSTDFTDPSHPSYSTFYHLQGLFPKEYVIAAMTRLPNEADSKILCKAIMELM